MATDLFAPGAFAMTASPETARVWAGRPEAHRRAVKLVRQMLSRSESSLDVLWANFGSGKSHFLLHLLYLAELQASDVKLIASYVEVPEQNSAFH